MKSSLLRGFFVDLVMGLRLGRLVDMVDLATSYTGSGARQFTFADLVHYQQRYLNPRTDLVKPSNFGPQPPPEVHCRCQ